MSRPVYRTTLQLTSPNTLTREDAESIIACLREVAATSGDEVDLLKDGEVDVDFTPDDEAATPLTPFQAGIHVQRELTELDDTLCDYASYVFTSFTEVHP